MFTGLRSDAPTRKHLRHWERVCLYLDAQPYRALRFPFPLDPPVTARLLKRMARFGLVRHKEDCSWQLTRRWRPILRRLWEGTSGGEGDEPPTPVDGEAVPFVADTNVDTLYVSLFAPALPRGLVERCDALKAAAQLEDAPVETCWCLFDAPLSMWKAGVGTSEKGGGVSWSYLLRNAYVMLRLRRKPLQGLVGSVRLSAEALWTFGPRAALDACRSLLADLWATGAPPPIATARATWRTAVGP